MVFLEKFELVSEQREDDIIYYKKNIFNSPYPLRIFSLKQLKVIEFDTITIFYGGNGSGKTTLLNIIADKIRAYKRNINKRGELFNIYVENCKEDLYKISEVKEIKYIASDDVFDYLLDLRAINSNVNRRKDELSEEYLNSKYNSTSSNNIDYNELRNKVDSRKMTQSKYIRSRLTNDNIIQKSNGESALDFWQEEIKDNGIYLLDEPENSLSAENQVKLKQFIEESARFYNCQFIISTHSPFLLGLDSAKIYDLDEKPARIRKWTELKSVRVYHDFFESNKDEF